MIEEQLAWLAERVPRIPPRPPGEARPFWSVVIPTHDRADLLRVALASVLDERIDAAVMEIVVMDDASPGSGIEAMVRGLGGGRVAYHRHPENVGQFANVNEGIRRARGHWIHVLHDDDWVMPGFYQRMQEAVTAHPSAGAGLAALTLADAAGRPRNAWSREQTETGLLPNWLWRVATSARIQPPAVVVRRDVYETLGGYNPEFPWPADWEMWVRIASHYDWVYQPNACACYRDTESSVSSRAKRTGSNIADVRKAIAFFSNYQDDRIRPAIRTAATRYWVDFAFATALGMMRRNDFEGAANQLRECLETDPSEKVVRAITGMARHL